MVVGAVWKEQYYSSLLDRERRHGRLIAYPDVTAQPVAVVACASSGFHSTRHLSRSVKGQRFRALWYDTIRH
jgi:hypothetical protein